MAKLWVDDIRLPPPGWLWAKNYIDAVAYLVTGKDSITEISLDNDLGGRYEGYDIAKMIEEWVATDENYIPPVMHAHSQNTVGFKNIRAAIDSIDRMMEKRQSVN